MQEHYQCIICLEIPLKVQTSDCCDSIVCESCFQSVQNKENICPMCRASPFVVIKNRAIEKIIKNLPMECQFCNDKTTFGDLEQHYQNCEKKEIHCQICDFKDNKLGMLDHLKEKHSKEVLLEFVKEYREFILNKESSQIMKNSQEILPQKEQSMIIDQKGLLGSQIKQPNQEQMQNSIIINVDDKKKKLLCPKCEQSLVYKNKEFTKNVNVICDKCFKKCDEYGGTWRCFQCDYDQCNDCRKKFFSDIFLKCKCDQLLVLADHFIKNNCDECNSKCSQSYRCKPCNYDRCLACTLLQANLI